MTLRNSIYDVQAATTLTLNQDTLMDLLIKTFEAIVVLAVLLIIARLVKGAIFRVTTRTSRNPNLSTLLSNLAYVSVVVLCVIWILSIYTGTGLSSLITLLGIVSVAISLSVQDVLKNFVAGIFLLLEQPFKIGDRIRVRDVEGKVETIEIRTTKLTTDDGMLVIIPNSIVFSEVVTNRTASEYTLMTIYVTLKSGQSMNQITGQVRQTLVGFGNQLIAANPAPAVRLESVSEGVTKARIEFWTGKNAPRSTGADVAAALRQALPEIDLSTEKPA